MSLEELAIVANAYSRGGVPRPARPSTASRQARREVRPSRKLTWKPKKGPIKTTVPLKGGYMDFHVSLGECRCILGGDTWRVMGTE